MRHVACLLVAIFILNSQAGEGPQRAANRQARTKAIKSLAEAIKKSQGAYLNSLNTTCQWLAGLKAKDELGKLIAEIEKLDEKYSITLRKTADGLAENVPLDDAHQKEFAGKIKAAGKIRANSLLDVAKTLMNSGLSGHAYDLTQQALEYDPDNAAARQALGYVKVGENWLTTFAATQAQKGNIWLPEFGYVPAAGAERIKKGEWFENGKWMPLEDADKLHAEQNTAWTIETDHFIVKSSAPRKEAVALADRAEGYFRILYRKYIEFFMRGSDKRNQLVFTQAPLKKLNIIHFGSRNDFQAFVKKEVKVPALAALVSQLPGLYFYVTHTLYFNRLEDNVFNTIFLQHELANQIVIEYTQANSPFPKPWLTNGMAQVIEFATPDNNGKWSLPEGHRHPAVSETAKYNQDGTRPPLGTLLNLNEDLFKLPPVNDINNNTSGAFMLFLMENADGARALDLLEFMYDSYKGVKAANINDYLGLDTPALEKDFTEYLK